MNPFANRAHSWPAGFDVAECFPREGEQLVGFTVAAWQRIAQDFGGEFLRWNRSGRRYARDVVGRRRQNKRIVAELGSAGREQDAEQSIAMTILDGLSGHPRSK